jgi:hypothetical protein
MEIAEKHHSLECPEYGSKLAWNRSPFCRIVCPWTEHKARPGSGIWEKTMPEEEGDEEE